MKKIALLFSISFLSVATYACDICGCGAGNSYIGILPDFYKHIYGIRYRHNSLYTHIGVGGANTYLTTRENYNNMELWGGWKLGEKLRVMLTLPYSFNEKINQGSSKNKNGLGDISVAGYYQLLNNKKAVLKNKSLSQTLWIGGGVKIASGEYNPADKSGINQNANLFQLGTGSTDFSLAAMYDVKLQNTGMNISASYKINTTNKYDYTYGNKLSLTTQFYQKIKIGNIALAPNAGLQFESGKKDTDNHFKVDLSGGNVLMGTIGLETSFKTIAIGANWQTPFSQNMAGGFVKANNRMMVHVAFAL